MLGAVVPALGPYRAPKHLLLGDGWSPRIDCTESVWMAPRCPPATPDPPAAEGASEVVGGLGRGQQEPLGLQLSQPCAPQHHEGMKGSGFKRCKHLQDLFRSVFTPKVWGAPCSPSIWECIPSPPINVEVDERRLRIIFQTRQGPSAASSRHGAARHGVVASFSSMRRAS